MIDELLEIQQKSMKLLKDRTNEVINAPLNEGLMDKKEHNEFKKDLDKWSALAASGRTTEAESFLKKITEKYDKRDKEDGI